MRRSDWPFIGLLGLVVWLLFRERPQPTPVPVNDLSPVSDLVASVSSAISDSIREVLRPYEMVSPEPARDLQFEEMIVDVPDPADFLIPDEVDVPAVSWGPPPGEDHAPWMR